MSDKGSDGMTEALARIEALEAELEREQRTLALLEAKAPSRGCNTPAHAAAPARIAELESELGKLQQGSSGRFTDFLGKLGKDRSKRQRAEVTGLKLEIAKGSETAHGDRSLLATLKELRLKRTALLAEIQILRGSDTTR